jgi:glycosyltransferase involved in cell wall biosynthesis
MQIAVDVRSLMEGRLSGVEQYTTELLRALIAIASQHEWHLFYNSYQPVILPEFIGPNVAVHGFNYSNRLFNTSQLLAGWPQWDRLVPADVVFVPNVRLAPVSRQTPLVVTAHDLSFEHFPEFYSTRRRLWHGMMRPRQLMQNADHVIAVSESTKQDVVTHYGIAEGNVSVIHSGVSLPVALSGSERAAVLDRLQIFRRFALFLGTFEPRKNIVSIIEAFSAIAGQVDHDLVLAGSPGWLMGEIKKALAASPVRDRIHYLGFVSNEDKGALYSLADVFVYPSFYEGFGFPPLEALLTGTPVITSHNSSLPEVVGKYATLINPYDVGELALVLKELLNDPPPVTESMKNEIKHKYSWHRAAAQTLAVLENVA